MSSVQFNSEINASEILQEMDRLCPSIISEVNLKKAFNKLATQLSELNIYDNKRINDILKDSEPVIFTLKLFPEEYLFWLSAKLSISEREYIQAILNNQIIENNGEIFIWEVQNIVLPTLSHYFEWTDDKNIDEVQIWLEVTSSNDEDSIFHPSVRQLVYLHLKTLLINKTESESLKELIYFGKNQKRTSENRGTKESKFVIELQSVISLSEIFNVLKRRGKLVSQSSPDIALWISRNFHGQTVTLKDLKFNQHTLIRYLESEPDSTHEAHQW